MPDFSSGLFLYAAATDLFLPARQLPVSRSVPVLGSRAIELFLITRLARSSAL